MTLQTYVDIFAPEHVHSEHIRREVCTYWCVVFIAFILIHRKAKWSHWFK
jgi:hypothetical protein